MDKAQKLKDPGPLSPTVSFTVCIGRTQVIKNVSRPTEPPEGCCTPDSEQKCLACGRALGEIKPGHCYVVEGLAALKGYEDRAPARLAQ